MSLTNMENVLITWSVFMGKYANIHAIYEVAPINDVARNTKHS